MSIPDSETFYSLLMNSLRSDSNGKKHCGTHGANSAVTYSSRSESSTVGIGCVQMQQVKQMYRSRMKESRGVSL